jgi:hypothetical protein
MTLRTIPNVRNHSFKFFGGVGPIPRKSATPRARSQNPRLAKLLSGFLLLSSINRDIPLSPIRAARPENRKEKNEERRKKGLESSPAPQLAQGSFCLPQLLVLRLGLLQDGDVGVGVFPECEEVLIGDSGFLLVACQYVGATELEMRKGDDWFI